ncbi:hypothetical protein KUTeg_021496 [Tegillarca granosa]|uniref:Impact N-terminal domain-containing protein n=1 Tax=Tegillarca granosa TaxID=220873 RepID=A0ABQ9E3X1_TEGGR|nr:hypothetical protein KUTeg_021496 [Tegillarca granosa]
MTDTGVNTNCTDHTGNTGSTSNINIDTGMSENTYRETLREILNGISDIKHTLNTVVSRIDEHDSKIKSLENDITLVQNDIYDKNGIKETLDSISKETNEHTCHIVKLTEDNKTSDKIRKIDIQQTQLTDLQTRSMKDNIVVTGLVETDMENLREKLIAIFRNELQIDKTIQIINAHISGPPPKCVNGYPRVVIARLQECDRALVLSKARALKSNNSKIRINPQFPESVREKRKRLFEVQSQLNKQNIDTKVYGDKLVYKKSGTVFREKVALPKANDVFHTALYIKNRHKFASGDTYTENGNFIIGRAMSACSIQDVRNGLSELLSIPEVTSSTHNIVAYRFTDEKGVIHDGIEDDGEYGGDRNILSCFKEEGFNNVLVVVSRTFGQKLGAKRFTFFKTQRDQLSEKLETKLQHKKFTKYYTSKFTKYYTSFEYIWDPIYNIVGTLLLDTDENSNTE